LSISLTKTSAEYITPYKYALSENPKYIIKLYIYFSYVSLPIIDIYISLFINKSFIYFSSFDCLVQRGVHFFTSADFEFAPGASLEFSNLILF